MHDEQLEAFRRHGYESIDWIVDHFRHVEDYRVLPDIRPGAVRAALPPEAPDSAETYEHILRDFRELIVPNTTHWNHPGFLAYFATTATPPGILGELLAAALNVNAMLWRTGPAQTELEEVTMAWLRELIGLPAEFDGHINDTASSSTLYALAAAREQLADLRLRQHGMTGRDVPRLRVYCSEEAHSSVDKAALTLGVGLDGIRKIPTDDDYSMSASALRSAIEEDIRNSIRPMAVVATIGTTSTTAVDPVPAIAEVCHEHGIWLHVDAAYGGAAAILPEMREIMAGTDHADSLVINPHKWLGVPVDCSALYTRKPELLRAAFSLTPEYLVTPEGSQTRNLMDFGISLGRRFRALKLWFVLRAYGAEQIREVLRGHLRLAQAFADEVDAAEGFERLAPVRFSVVVFRHVPSALQDDPAELDRHNLALLERVNASGEFLLSHTRTRQGIALRLAIGNWGTTGVHVNRAWELIRSHCEG